MPAAQAQHQVAAAQVQAAQSAATQSRANQAFTVITAPSAGLVMPVPVDAGAMATPGTPLLRIEDARQHEVDIQVNESMLVKLRPEPPVQVATSTESSINGPSQRSYPARSSPAPTRLPTRSWGNIALPALTALYSVDDRNCRRPGRSAECHPAFRQLHDGARSDGFCSCSRRQFS